MCTGPTCGRPSRYYAAAPYYAAPTPYYAPYYAPAPAPVYSMAVPVPSGPEPPPADAAEVRLHVSPEDAAVYVDGEFRGTARQLRILQLEPGRHTLEVTRPGFRVETREVDVAPGTLTSVRIELKRP